MRIQKLVIAFFCYLFLLLHAHQSKGQGNTFENIRKEFKDPTAPYHPGVYWYFMDGNLSKEGITKDLQSMKDAGITSVLFLEVNIGVPRGKVNFFSEEWQDLFAYAEHECERLGIEMIMGIGPGWAGSGGPWVKPESSMQHLTAEVQYVSEKSITPIKLKVAPPKKPYFGENVLTPELRKEWENYYRNVAVLAFPLPDTSHSIANFDGKALYYRAPYTSGKVKPYLPATIDSSQNRNTSNISPDRIINLTSKLLPDGTLNWKIPKGNWVIMYFVARNNGAVTRPAPIQGLGFEANKMDTVAINQHLDHYIGTLLKKIGDSYKTSTGGLKRLHMDSWEMGAQNWTANFRNEFSKRRGYDPLPFYPTYLGFIVKSKEISERFLWDMRQTSQELILENHAQQVKKYAHKNGLRLSIEPYDMNPTADLELGNIADVPMAEFWSRNRGDFRTEYSVIEATSIAHVNGISLVPAESFTSHGAWQQYPGYMKEESDWAFAAGINKFMFHTFQNQNLPDSLKPGMTMGPYGVQWNRNQTWWPMVHTYHSYLARCSYLLQQGNTVADILYLNPEGNPFVFCPPASALDISNSNQYPDRKGYNFDGCAPTQLYKAFVKNHKIMFPGGASYHVLVLPDFKIMTAKLLRKIRSLIYDGAIIIGNPPLQSPGLSNYPSCDLEVKSIASSIWHTLKEPKSRTTISYGKGKVIWGGDFHIAQNELYPSYDATATILKEQKVQEDFHSTGNIRYTHRRLSQGDIYFIANKTDKKIEETVSLRAVKGTPQLWNPIDGKIKELLNFDTSNNCINIPVTLDAFESSFIILSEEKPLVKCAQTQTNFSEEKLVENIKGPWTVSFDTKWGGPAHVQFDSLQDWSANNDSCIKYYSGIARYKKDFDIQEYEYSSEYILDLGNVKNMANVRLNGNDLGNVWTFPWKISTKGFLKKGKNHLEISVANLWINRLVGDAAIPSDGPKNGQWPEWLINGKPRTSRRYTFVTNEAFTKDSPLSPSGLLGPVRLLKE